MSAIDRLIADFVKVHKADYFEMQPYIQYLRAAYALGLADIQVHNIIAVKRSDGRRYTSILEAAKDNLVHKSSISKAIKKGNKSAGYYWQKQ